MIVYVRRGWRYVALYAQGSQLFEVRCDGKKAFSFDYNNFLDLQYKSIKINLSCLLSVARCHNGKKNGVVQNK